MNFIIHGFRFLFFIRLRHDSAFLYKLNMFICISINHEGNIDRMNKNGIDRMNKNENVTKKIREIC